MKYAILLLGMVCGTAFAEVGGYPNASALTGPERFLADQNQQTVNITSTQIEAFVCTIIPTACLLGSTSPSLVAGANISISGTWPNQTVTGTAPTTGMVPFTSITGCSNTTVLGGSAAIGGNVFVGAGSFNAGASGTCTATINFAQTAQNDWSCSGNDMTSQIIFVQSARSATSCTITGAASSSDTIVFQAQGY